MNTPKDTERFYDTYHKDFMETYGDTIQANRTKEIKELHKHTIRNAGIKKGMRIIDAGSGVCGPSIFFAKKKKVKIKAITISKKQADTAKERVKNTRLKGDIRVIHGDYHKMKEFFKTEDFDLILFLESLGHSNNPEKVIQDSFDLLKRGGAIYIKDFFPLYIENEDIRKKHKEVLDDIRKDYTYNVLDLNDTIKNLRKTGFEIDFIRRVELKIDHERPIEFEKRYDIKSYSKGIRHSEWLEIRCIKPKKPLF